jgi:hypothetical protein
MEPPIRSRRITAVRQSLAAVFSPAFRTSSPVGLAEINAVRIQLRLRYLPMLCGANTRAALTTPLSCSTRSKEKAISGPGGHPSRRNGWLGHIVAALTRQDRCGHFFGSILFRKNSPRGANRCYTVDPHWIEERRLLSVFNWRVIAEARIEHLEGEFGVSVWSSSPGEFHPEALTEPCVNLSIHTALHSRSLLSFESKPSREERAHPEHPVGRTLRRAMSSSSLPIHYRRFNATIG